MKPTLVIMAAGMGSRFGGLKQLEKIGPNEETLLDYSIYDAISAGFGKVVFIIRKDFEDEFKKTVGLKLKEKIEFDYVYQSISDIPDGYKFPKDRKKPWGTAHAIYSCKDKVNEPFAVINADDFYNRKSFILLSDALKNTDVNDKTYYMVSFALKNTLSKNGAVSRGVCKVNNNSQLINITEFHNIKASEENVICQKNGVKEIIDGDTLVSMNMWGFYPNIFKYLRKDYVEFFKNAKDLLKDEYYLPSFVDMLIKNNIFKVNVLSSSEKWFGVTYPEDKNFVVDGIKNLIKKGIYPEKI